MNPNEILELAADIAGLLDIYISNLGIIKRKMRGLFPKTTILHNNRTMLWIDLHYIAVAGSDDAELLYIYIDEQHVLEELPEVIRLRDHATSDADYCLRAEVAKQLTMAQLHMNQTGEDFFLLPDYKNELQRRLKTWNSK